MTDTARPRAASIRARLRFDCFLFFLQVTLVDVRSGEEIERVILPLDSFHVGHYHIQRTGKVNCSREVNINCGNRWALFDTYAHLPLSLTQSITHSACICISVFYCSQESRVGVYCEFEFGTTRKNGSCDPKDARLVFTIRFDFIPMIHTVSRL